ncbi:hypothetical protein TRVL_07905 [Trypanosoma vivax]|nr:hypothetical protein TRVL_07905 [Trypanosoma vivax]
MERVGFPSSSPHLPSSMPDVHDRALIVNIMELVKHQEIDVPSYPDAVKVSDGGVHVEHLLVVFADAPPTALVGNSRSAAADGIVMRFLMSSSDFERRLQSPLAGQPAANDVKQTGSMTCAYGNNSGVTKGDGITGVLFFPDVAVRVIDRSRCFSLLYVQLDCDRRVAVDRATAQHRVSQIINAASTLVFGSYPVRLCVDFTGLLDSERCTKGLEPLRDAWWNPTRVHPRVLTILLAKPSSPRAAPGVVGGCAVHREEVRLLGDAEFCSRNWLLSKLYDEGCDIVPPKVSNAFGNAAERYDNVLNFCVNAREPPNDINGCCPTNEEMCGPTAGVTSAGDGHLGEGMVSGLTSVTRNSASSHAGAVAVFGASGYGAEVFYSWAVADTLGAEDEFVYVRESQKMTRTLTSLAARRRNKVACLFLEHPSDPSALPLSVDVSMRQLLVFWSALGMRHRKPRIIVVVSDGDFRFEEALLSWVRVPWNENALIFPIFVVGDVTFCRSANGIESTSSSAPLTRAYDDVVVTARFSQLLRFSVHYFGIDLKCSACLTSNPALVQAARGIGIQIVGDYACVYAWVGEFLGVSAAAVSAKQGQLDVELARERAFCELCVTSDMARDLRNSARRPELLMRHWRSMRIGIVRPVMCDTAAFVSGLVDGSRLSAYSKLSLTLSQEQRSRVYGYMVNFFTKDVFSVSVNNVRSSVGMYFTGYRFSTTGYLKYELSSHVRRHLSVKLWLNLHPLVREQEAGAELPHWSTVFRQLSCSCTPRPYERVLKTESGEKKCRHLAQLLYWFLRKAFASSESSVPQHVSAAACEPTHRSPRVSLPANQESPKSEQSTQKERLSITQIAAEADGLNGADEDQLLRQIFRVI